MEAHASGVIRWRTEWQHTAHIVSATLALGGSKKTAAELFPFAFPHVAQTGSSGLTKNLAAAAHRAHVERTSRETGKSVEQLLEENPHWRRAYEIKD